MESRIYSVLFQFSQGIIRRQRGLPPRAVILPWTRLDDDRALARVKALASSQQSAQPAPDNSTQSPLSREGSAQT